MIFLPLLQYEATLCRDGKPELRIVGEGAAADEPARTLREITGAEFAKGRGRD